MLKESAQLMQRLWAEERVTFAGEHFQTAARRSTTGPRAASRSTSRPRVPRRRGWRGGSPTASSHERQGPGAVRREAAARRARGHREGGRSARRGADARGEGLLRRGSRRARCEDTRYWGALALTPEEKIGVEDPIEMQRLADALPVERTVTPLDRLRRPRGAGRQIQPYIDLGFTHLVFHFPGPDQERALRSTASTCCRGCASRPRNAPPQNASASGLSSSSRTRARNCAASAP